MSHNRRILRDDIILLENFLSPCLRQEILSHETSTKTPGEEYYAGKSAPLPDSLVDKLLQKLKLYGLSYERLVTARIRLATHDDDRDFRSLIHTDHNARWNFVIYVENSLYKAPAQAGTLFWEHRITKKNKLDLSNPRNVFLHSLIIERDSKDLTMWNEWLNSPFIENSAIFFNSLYFHSPPSPSFAKNTPGKRITVDIFLD